MALRVQIYKLSCKHLNVGRFIRNGEGRSINIRFYANYIAARPKRYRPSASKLLQPNKGNQIDYKSFVTKVYFWPLRSFVGYIGQGVNRAGGRFSGWRWTYMLDSKRPSGIKPWWRHINQPSGTLPPAPGPDKMTGKKGWICYIGQELSKCLYLTSGGVKSMGVLLRSLME